MKKRIIAAITIVLFLFVTFNLSSIAAENQSDEEVKYIAAVQKELEVDPTCIIVQLTPDCFNNSEKYDVDFFNKEILFQFNNSIVDVIELYPKISDAGYSIRLKLILDKKIQKSMDDIIELLEKNPVFDLVEKDYYLPLYGTVSIYTPNDPFYASEQYYLNQVQANRAWMVAKNYTNNITVGVLDSGIQNTHSDLSGRINTGISANFSSSQDLTDNNGHGTKVAGIISATINNNIGVAGLGWNTKIANIKCANDNGSVSTSAATSALLYAQQCGLKVVNCSFGLYYPTNSLRDAVENFSGMIVAACGNSGTQLVIPVPAAYRYDNVISVAATTSADVLWSSSNYGSANVDLAAPGANIYGLNNNSGYGYGSGTSFAAPLVTATVAMIWNINPNFSVSQVRSFILDNVDILDSLNNKVASNGRLNTFKAVLAASGNTMGDVNQDGRINSTDSRIILRVAANLETISDIQAVVADLNYDGVVNSSDSRILLQMITGSNG